MKRRNKIIVSIFACVCSICLMCFGVYAAVNPSVSINGQVSYTARDARLLVQGKVNGAKDKESVDYPAASVTANDLTATKVTNEQTRYLDYTKGTGNDPDDVLADWNVDELEFAEDSKGVKDIVLNFKFTNLSTFPVKATLTFGKSDAELEQANVTRKVSETEVTLVQNGGNKEITITYNVKNDSQKVTGENLLGMNITFEQTKAKTGYELDSTERTTGIINVPTIYSDGNATVAWQCFAYYDETQKEWVAFDSTNGIPEGTKQAYFAIKGYAHDNLKQKYSEYSANDNRYYSSSIRQIVRNLDKENNAFGFWLDTTSEVYSFIQGRTISDLYKNNLATYSNNDYSTDDQTVPSNIDGNAVEDKFWLMSVYEAKNFFASDTERKWTNGNVELVYMLRSALSNASGNACTVKEDGKISNFSVDKAGAFARPAFMLKLA